MNAHVTYFSLYLRIQNTNLSVGESTPRIPPVLCFCRSSPSSTKDFNSISGAFQRMNSKFKKTGQTLLMTLISPYWRNDIALFCNFHSVSFSNIKRTGNMLDHMIARSSQISCIEVYVLSIDLLMFS